MGKFIIEYTDDIRIKGEWHKHKCEQLLQFDLSGEIVEIEHKDLSGELESLDTFFKKYDFKR